jgi:outer membrane protein assembly factor BamB
MRCRTRSILVLSTFLSAVTGLAQEDIHWPSFRGAAGRGVAEGHATPERWDLEQGENLLWRTELPGLAHSSPVVWGDRIFVTTAVSDGGDDSLKVGLYGDIAPVEDDSVHAFRVIAIDKKTGDVLWSQLAHEGVPRIKRHTKATHASSTPATDGRHVAAFFGSEGLYLYDISGKLLWKKDFGVLDSGFFRVPEAQWGFGNSPIIYGDSVIVLADVQENSFLGAYALADGRELWKTARNDVPTWTTPTVHGTDERTQVIVNGFRHSGGYDVQTGRELWRMSAAGDIPVPRPFIVDGMIILSSAHGDGAPLTAVRPSATGDITLAEGQSSSEHVAWSHPRDGSYISTPIGYRGLVYVLRGNGALSAFDARSGERLYRERVGGDAFSASPVAADGKLYLTSEEGDVFVVRAGPKYEEIARNSLGEVTMATPAVSEGVLIFRTRSHLVAIAHASPRSVTK